MIARILKTNDADHDCGVYLFDIFEMEEMTNDNSRFVLVKKVSGVSIPYVPRTRTCLKIDCEILEE